MLLINKQYNKLLYISKNAPLLLHGLKYLSFHTSTTLNNDLTDYPEKRRSVDYKLRAKVIKYIKVQFPLNYI